MSRGGLRATAALSRLRRVSLVLATLAFGLGLGLVAAEAALRLGIAFDVGGLRDPRLYAGWLDDDDQWLLRHRWGIGSALTDQGFEIHPVLGWLPRRSADNPLGSVARRPPPPARGPSILCVGDSFMAGASSMPMNERLPHQLDRRTPGRRVYNFAVPGYGLDQILLRTCGLLEHFERPTLVVGVMTLDLDRSLLQVRDAPKPRFVLDAGRLQLTNVPLPADPEVWFRAHPVALKSFGFALLRQKLRLRQVAGHEDRLQAGGAAKQALNQRLLEALVEVSRAHDAPLLVVLLYPPWQLAEVGWRETFLARSLEQLGVPYVDSKSVFLEQATDAATRYYLAPPDNHPNAAGNAVLAAALAVGVRHADRTPAPAAPATGFICPQMP